MKSRILKNAKALSPVVASIILIAVTVAVSIAVAAWMASLTSGQMQTEGITFTSYTWATPSGTSIPWVVISVKNTGASDLSISQVLVDNAAVATTNITSYLPYSLSKGSEVAINITKTFTRGVPYGFSVMTSKGHEFGPYQQTAP
jgi:flagellin-like protein